MKKQLINEQEPRKMILLTLSQEEYDLFEEMCERMDTTPVQELKIFIRQNLHAEGLWDPQNGLISQS